MSTMKVAVSGVGGAVGQGVMKCLSISELPVEIYPVDIQPLSAGLFRGVEGFVLPKPELHGGLKEWEHCMVQHGIEALIPGSDYDLIPLATVRDDWEAKGICKVLVSDLELVQTCRDKALTCQRLEKEGIPVPKSAWELSLKDAISWAKSTGYPVVIKPRGGSASQNGCQSELLWLVVSCRMELLTEPKLASGRRSKNFSWPLEQLFDRGDHSMFNSV